MMNVLKKILQGIGVIFVILIVVAFVVEDSKTPEEKAAEKAQQAEAKQQQAKLEAEAIPAYTASDIAKAYDSNTVAADRKFKDKKFKVTGTIGDISTNILGEPYVTLRGGVNPFMEPQFELDESQVEAIAKLKKGNKISMICIGGGDIAKTPMSKSCVLL